jgi:hypothetical protein
MNNPERCTFFIDALLNNMEKLWLYNYYPLKEIQKIFGPLNFSETELKENFVKEKFSWFARKPTDKEKDYTITGFSFNTWSNLS